MIFSQYISNASAKETSQRASIDGDIGAAIEKVSAMVTGFFEMLPNLIIGVVVFAVFYMVSKFVRKLISKPTKPDVSGLSKVLGRVSQWAILLLGFLIAAAVILPSVTPGKIISALGFGSVAIGFAFKDILQNFLAGILILVREPFKKGDQVVFGDFEGTVEKIDTRSTFMKTYDGRKVLIPNGQVYTNPMVILTAYEHRRSQYDIGIGYGDDIGKACEIILKTMKSLDGVASEPAPDVLVSELAGSSVNLRARWWTSPQRADVVKIDSAVKKAIKLALDEASVDMPYPTQVLLLHDQTEETDGDRTAQREGWPVGDNPPKPRRRPQENSDA